MKTKLSLTLTAIAVAIARAEEGGGGHYLPGATSSFIDALPGRPGLAVVNYFTYYDASVSASRSLPLAGLLAADLEATIYADTVGLIYETPWRLLGGDYAAGLAVPYLWMEVRGEVALPGGGTGPRRNSVNGVGDIQILPFMIGWTHGPNWKYDVRLGVYAPSGDFEAGRIANVGKNFWTFEPGASVSWLSTKIGTEATLFAGFDVNTKNHETDYQSGATFHLDGTVAQHLPLLGGVLGVGANGFYYQQISGDSG
ncbi:MAG: transporter, partial [Verrucomicrobiae bacterium]|nr:transporter [Verrucomicrobiae bacterium]